MNNVVNSSKKYIGWLRKHKIVTILVVLVAIIMLANLGHGSDKNSGDSAATTSPSSVQNQTDNNASRSATPAPSTSSTNKSSDQSTPTKPPLRQDLAFQGNADYCDGIYKDNGDGTTTWSYDIKQNGELITHLSDNNGHAYRHDVQITDAPNFYAYTAPVAIKDVAEINGVLTVSSDGSSYPCNLSPQQQPQQPY